MARLVLKGRQRAPSARKECKMRGLNKAYLIGNIGHDPELKSTPTGLALLHVRIATPGAKKVGDEWVETPDWHRLTLFERNAEFVGKYAHKGDVLAVECVIRQTKWTDKDNVTHYKTELVVERVLWLNGARRNADVGVDTEARASRPPISPGLEENVMEEPPF